MNSSPYSVAPITIPRNSFVALLLQPTLHNFCALASVTHFDGITYRQNVRETRKSNAALLLPALFPASSLLRYSYRKIGGGGPARRSFSLPSEALAKEVYTPLASESIQQNRKSQCCLPLTRNRENARKMALCFLSLTDIVSRNYQCCLSLRKKGRGRGRAAKAGSQIPNF
jgi:hypothetical protein